MSKTALEVCEGQQYDVDFETSTDVSIAQYLEMIRLKTAVLVGCAMEMGARIGGADPADAKQLYRFGEQLGIAFQLQDDYLDTFGDAATFGKRIGGDIAENKKTILVHLTHAHGRPEQQQELTRWFSDTPKDDSTKIAAVTELFKAAKADTATLAEVARYTKNAFAVLDGLKVNINKFKINCQIIGLTSITLLSDRNSFKYFLMSNQLVESGVPKLTMRTPVFPNLMGG